jgi:hypothetical protein
LRATSIQGFVMMAVSLRDRDLGRVSLRSLNVTDVTVPTTAT